MGRVRYYRKGGKIYRTTRSIPGGAKIIRRSGGRFYYTKGRMRVFAGYDLSTKAGREAYQSAKRSARREGSQARLKALEEYRKKRKLQIGKARKKFDVAIGKELTELGSKRYGKRYESRRRSAIKSLREKRTTLRGYGDEAWVSNVDRLFGRENKSATRRLAPIRVSRKR